MGKVSTPTLWTNLIVISGTWGSSFVFVKLITESMYPFAFAASRGFIAMTALLAWLASRRRALPAYGSGSLPRLWKIIGHMVVLGITNRWLTNVLTATAVSRVDSAVVAMLQAAVPLMVAVLAREHRAGVRS
jgi:drug/metabolite transporter (DMT)-like permease